MSDLPRQIGGALRAGLDCIVGLLLPKVCAACGSEDVAGDGLCAACGRRLLVMVSLPYCPRCGTTLGPYVRVSEEGCWACVQPLPRFTRVVRLGPYCSPLREVIRQLKYRCRDVMRRRLGTLLAEAAAARCDAERLDVVLPVPMHWRRRLVRGYDHARALAGAIARPLRLPVGDELVRVRHTPPQWDLSRTARVANVRGAFAARHGASLAGANVLLLDDICTTGATANEAARTLLAAGALSVTLAVVAKTEPPTAYAAYVAAAAET